MYRILFFGFEKGDDSMDFLKLDEYPWWQILGSQIALYGGMIVVIILSFFICKKHGISKISTLLFILLGYSGGIYCAKLMGDLYSKVSMMFGGGRSNVAIFGVVVGLPFVLIFVSLITGKKWRNITDLFAPGAFLGLAFAKFGCFLSGCCPGIECTFGIYNNIYDKVMFPSQICESITMVFVVAFSFWYSLKYKKRIPGSAYPITAMLYAFTRFCWEFMRYYDLDKMKHLLFGLSFWQLWCIAVFVLSVIWLYILKIPKLAEYEEKYYSWQAVQFEKVKSKLFKGKKANEATEESIT